MLTIHPLAADKATLEKAGDELRELLLVSGTIIGDPVEGDTLDHYSIKIAWASLRTLPTLL